MKLFRTISSSDNFNRLKLKFFKNSNIFFKLKRFLPSTSESLRTKLISDFYNIKVIIDIGANKGQFSEQQLILGYKGKIVSFEPSQNAHDALSKRAEKYANWTVHEPLAIGEKDSELEFHEYTDSVFNSFLKVKEDFRKDKDYLKDVVVRKVKVARLDDLLPSILTSESDNFLLKIDTQGYEKQVLEGCKNYIKKASIIKIEIPVKAMYENVEWTFYDTIEYMKELNFHPINFDIEGVNKNGIVRTIDMSFLNTNMHKLHAN
ncbi:FkbM family methyltransferase [Portibacter lacus]|uniref:Methyltransferase FkbM domain-containing protein n=1 Tax=Portibacter lacus TaxID=1099794 RepID=A0AA37SVC1_9BACT|nr:FkbM family methyltransferase [Portibacter lacus]GLR18843.1 hypothetical protein GCM10007940_34590 [Portibacter lacus]